MSDIGHLQYTLFQASYAMDRDDPQEAIRHLEELRRGIDHLVLNLYDEETARRLRPNDQFLGQDFPKWPP